MTRWSKYLAFVRIAAREANEQRGEMLGRVAFFGVILGVFSALWAAAAKTGIGFDLQTRHRMVWYLAATEWIVLSVPMLHITIQEDVRRGDIVYQMGRPVSYVGVVLARGLGQLCVRSPWMGAAAFLWAFLFSGAPPNLRATLTMVPLGFLAANLLCVVYVLVGLTAFWLHEVNGVYWVTQKLTFILGGLMLPLSFYPAWLRDLARATPFSNILEGPAALLASSPPWSAGELLLRLLAWGGAFVALAFWMLRHAARTIEPGGG